MSLRLKVGKLPSDSLALTNHVYVSHDDFELLKGSSKSWVTVKRFTYLAEVHPKMQPGFVALSGIHRRNQQLAFDDEVTVTKWEVPSGAAFLGSVEFEATTLRASQKVPKAVETDDLVKRIRSTYEQHVLAPSQQLLVDYNGILLLLTVKSLACVRLESPTSRDAAPSVSVSDVSGKSKRSSSRRTSGKGSSGSGRGSSKSSSVGIIVSQTSMSFAPAAGSALKLAGSAAGGAAGGNTIFNPDFDFENMGIGGLDTEFQDIFRRAFASRVFPSSVVEKLGIKHVRGMLLYGPPGTGKTLMARQIGKMLNGKEPKVVNGPEILSKYVGESETNIRKLFKEAEAEQKSRGNNSDLHIIIFDEIDAICRQRGSVNNGTGVGDTVVNQLLSKIDGVDSLNNILIIGMTNRRDMLDEALLRPGRLEVQIQIGLPDQAGRLQILNIHTKTMSKASMLADDVDLSELSHQTRNFSGAEIEGLVKSAASFALNRNVDAKKLKATKADNIKVTRADFLRALEEVKPAFGMSEEEFDKCARMGIINYGSRFESVKNAGQLFVQNIQHSDRTPLVAVLVTGASGVGKTALAATLARESEFPFVKLISPENMVGWHDTAKAQEIARTFDNAYKSKVSCIVLDDIERLIDYVPMGPRFSNAVLQALLVLLKKAPPQGHKLLLFATSSSGSTMLRDLGIDQVFNATLTVPAISSTAEAKQIIQELKVFGSKSDKAASAFKGPMGIKKFLMLLEMAKTAGDGEDVYSVDTFISVLKTYA